MNANQLADELAFKHIAGDDSGAFSSKIITMLRQQQAEIEALKAHPVKELIEEKNYEVIFDGEKYTTKLVEPKVKELTDEEIADALYVADITLNNLSDGDISMERIKAFVRTVLKKAQK